MRVKLVAVVGEEIEDRITPAHAGKTHLVNNRPEMSKDHPRACG